MIKTKKRRGDESELETEPMFLHLCLTPRCFLFLTLFAHWKKTLKKPRLAPAAPRPAPTTKQHPPQSSTHHKAAPVRHPPRSGCFCFVVLTTQEKRLHQAGQ